MQRIIPFLPFVAILFCSCGQNKVETFEARAYYDSINKQFSFGKDLQQKLIDETTKAVLTIQSDKNATIDTKALRELLDSSKKINVNKQHAIEKIKEIDDEVNYKAKVLDYISSFNSFYDNELTNCINLLDQKQEDRYSKVSALLLPQLQIIKQKELNVDNAQDEFEVKYPINDDGSIITKPDYEYIKLSDFKYQQANIKEGEEISLLSFSGTGKECDNETKYYRQFIGIVKSTGDTIRILSACQYYDINIPLRTGYFQKEISDSINNIAAENSYIVFNKHQTSLEKKNFKTVIGSLAFDFK